MRRVLLNMFCSLAEPGTQNPNPVAQKRVKWDDVAPLQAGRPEKTFLKARQAAGQNAKTKTPNQLTAFNSSTVHKPSNCFVWPRWQVLINKNATGQLAHRHRSAIHGPLRNPL